MYDFKALNSSDQVRRVRAEGIVDRNLEEQYFYLHESSDWGAKLQYYNIAKYKAATCALGRDLFCQALLRSIHYFANTPLRKPLTKPLTKEICSLSC